MMGGGGGGGKDSKDCELSSPYAKLTSAFSFEELRDIFSVNLYTDGCQTRGCSSIDVS
jgi:hypothetical protein